MVKTGKAEGYGGVVTATVTLDAAGKIADITVSAPNETPNVAKNAIDNLPGAIKEAGKTEGVDIVAGATMTSRAILAAVNNALDPEKYPYKAST